MLRRIVRRLASREKQSPLWRSKVNVLETAIEFVIYNNIPGDYLEFGVYKGQSFAHAYKYFSRLIQKYVASRGDELSEYQSRAKETRFIAFDSFEGLPAVAQENLPLHWQGVAALKCPLDIFSENIIKAGVDLSDVRIVQGFYDKSLTDERKASHELTAGAIFHVDCDLYESTVHVLDFITTLIQDGSVIIFDDWFYYRGHPDRGEQGAFRQWLLKNPTFLATQLCSVHPAAAFIINRAA